MTWFAVGHLANDWPIAGLWLIVPAAGIAMDLSPAEVGLLFTLFSIGGSVAYIPAGFLADHVSDRGSLLVATFWWVAIGYGLAAFSSGFWSLAVLLAVAGMGNAAWHPIATGVLTRDNKEGRARALGIHALGGSFAEVLAPLSVGFLLSFVDWRGALLVSVVPTFLMGLCFIWVVRSVPNVVKKTANRQDMLDLLRMWRRGSGLRIAGMISLYNMSLIAILGMTPLYLASVHDLTSSTIGVIFAAVLITGAIIQPWVGGLSDTVGRRPFLVIGNTTAAVAITTLVFEPSFWLMIAAMAVAVAALDSIRAAMLATAVDHTDSKEGTTLGLTFVLMEGVGAFGAVLAGIAAGISWPYMFGVAAAFSFGSAGLSARFVGGQSAEDKASSQVGFLTAWRERMHRRREIKDRLSISQHLIIDIGMTRKEAEAEIAKWFWQK